MWTENAKIIGLLSFNILVWSLRFSMRTCQRGEVFERIQSCDELGIENAIASIAALSNHWPFCKQTKPTKLQFIESGIIDWNEKAPAKF